MKKAVLVIDHKERDLRGIVLIAYWLYTKYGIFPYLTTTKNEMASLIKYKPDILLLQHVRHLRQKCFLDYAKNQNTAIALLMAEGFANYPENILFGAGRDEFLSYVNLLFPWGQIFIKSCNKKHLIENAKVVAIGSPRFDYHTPEFKSLCMSRSEFSQILGINPDTPNVVWMTNSKYANPKEGFEKLVSRIKSPEASDHRIAGVIEPKTRDHQRIFDAISGYLLRLAKEITNINILIKVHPAEPIEVYENKFKDCSNVKIIAKLDKIPLTDLIRHADIQINWRCTTAAEAWLMDINKNVIGVEVANLELDEFTYLAAGCDMAADYKALREKVQSYLDGGKIPDLLLLKRQDFINDFLFSADGLSAQRCAREIAACIKNKAKTKPSLKNLGTYLKYLPKYRFNKNWVTLDRGENHAKYISSELVEAEIKNCEKLFGNKCEYRYL